MHVYYTNDGAVTRSLDEVERDRARELLAAFEQAEFDLIDSFTVRPASAQRCIRALEPFLPGGRFPAV